MRWRRARARWLAAVATGVVVLVLAGIWGLQRRLVYFPSPGPVPPAAAALDGARDVTLRTSDGLELGAWFVPARRDDRGVVALVAHGNGGDRAMRAPLAEALADRGVGVLLFDYRGYGGNAGSPSEEGLARDVRAAYRYLVEERKVPPRRLLFFGESLGCAVVAELAAAHPPGGLVLRSPFVDLAAAGQVHYPFLPVRALLRDRYAVAEHVRTVRVPTVVVYGTADSIIPAAQSRAVADAAAGPVEVVAVDGADHNDLVLLAGDALVDAVVDLADRVARAA